MRNVMLTGLSALMAIALSCNNKPATSQDDHAMMDHADSMPMTGHASSSGDIKMMHAEFSQMDPGVSVYMKSMMQQYLSIKNDLVEGKSKEAASAAGQMFDLMKGFDKSLLSADQKKVYDGIQDDLQEHAEHISKSELEHQREHFSMMSQDMYDMVKAFGAGMTIYHDHCPMYKNGSMWLSETRDIRNPYYGDQMMTCGTVEEMFQ